MKIRKGSANCTFYGIAGSVVVVPGTQVSEALVPGVGFSGTTTRSDVDGGGEYTQAGTSTAVCWWTEHPIQVCGSTYGETVDIGVVADHYNGIQKVGFIADGGTEIFVTSTTVVDSIEQYRITLDVSSKSAGDTVEVRAIAYPNHGRPRILQGNLQTDQLVADTNKQGFYSLKCTKISNISTTSISSPTTMLGAIQALGDISASTVQHRLVLDAGSFEAGPASALTDGWLNPDIPLIVEGSGTRETIIDSSTDYAGAGIFRTGSFHFKNLTWYATTVSIRPRGTTSPMYCYFENCDIGGNVQPVANGFTHTDTSAVSVQIISNPDNPSVSRLFSDQAYREHGNTFQTVSSYSDKSYGIWLENCNIGFELGEKVWWVKNCTSIDSLNDATHGGCILNLDIQNASFGTNKCYLLSKSILNWQANTDFPAGSIVLVEEFPNTWVILRNGSGSTLNTVSFNRSDGWVDDQYPHMDGWQARTMRDGTGVFSNIWHQGIATDTTSNIQPWFYRDSETARDCVWKDWNIQNTTAWTSALLAQMFTHMDHWIIDGCVWWDSEASVPSRSGDLLIAWADGGAARGWGQTLDNGSTIGCQNAIWRNSEIRGLQLLYWPSPKPTTLAEMETYISSLSGWDISIDNYTKSNSSIT